VSAIISDVRIKKLVFWGRGDVTGLTIAPTGLMRRTAVSIGAQHLIAFLKIVPELNHLYRSDMENCTSYQFRCNATGRCIPWSWVCDREEDCRDGADEAVDQHCIPPLDKCPLDKFACANKKCIRAEYYCDDEDDCGDNSDEPEYCKVCASSTHFLCKNRKCVLLSVLCDGKDDCGDNSDEHVNNTLCRSE